MDAAPAEPPETESVADETVEETPSIDEPDEEALSTDEPVEPAPEASDEAAADSEEEPVVEEAKVDEVSSYYHLARFDSTSSAKADH